MRKKFNRDDEVCDISPDRYSAHDVAGLLKLYFRELPDPLLTEAQFQNLLDATKITDHYETLYAYLEVLQKLPKSNHETLKRLVTHLSLIADHETTNMMGVKQLAIVFGPTLMDVTNPDSAIVDDDMSTMPKKYKVVEALITYHEWLFNMDGQTTIQKNLKEGYKRLEAATAQQASQTVAASTICEVFYEDTETVHSIALTAEMTGEEAAAIVVKKGKYPESKEWSITESLLEGKLVRPVEDKEKVRFPCVCLVVFSLLLSIYRWPPWERRCTPVYRERALRFGEIFALLHCPGVCVHVQLLLAILHAHARAAAETHVNSSTHRSNVNPVRMSCLNANPV